MNRTFLKHVLLSYSCSVGSDQYRCSRKTRGCRTRRSPVLSPVPMMRSARTETLWPTLLRSPGCSTPRWRKTSSLAAPSASRGENGPFFFGGAHNAAALSRPDGSRYKAVIEACSLQPDIDLLPFGDQTEIGERVCSFALRAACDGLLLEV